MGCTTKSVTNNGDKITWNYKSCNKGNCPSENNFVDITFSAGQVYLSSDPSHGSFDGAKWTIGPLAEGGCATLEVVTKVTDIAQAPFSDSALIYGDNQDPDPSNNQTTCIVDATTCPAVAGAFDITLCCGCGSVAKNDTPCSQGDTTYVIVGGSEDNITINDFDEVTGELLDSQLIDPALPGTFQYKIFCTYGGDTYEAAGPALVTIPAGNPETPCAIALKEKAFCGPVQVEWFRGVINEDTFVVPGVDFSLVEFLEVSHTGVTLDPDEPDPLLNSYDAAGVAGGVEITLTKPAGAPGAPCTIAVKYQICEPIDCQSTEG